MESEWRWGVYKMVGSTYAAWEYPGDQPALHVFLCARLVTPITLSGKVYTHLLKASEIGGIKYGYLARIQGVGNVLNEVRPFIVPPPNFPYGISVDPDHV